MVAMRAATLTASACGIALAACLTACGKGSAASAGSTSPPPAAQFLVAAMAPLPGGGFLWGDRLTGAIRRVDRLRRGRCRARRSSVPSRSSSRARRNGAAVGAADRERGIQGDE